MILFHCHPLPKGVFARNMPHTGRDGTIVDLVQCTRELGFCLAVAFAPDLASDDPDYGVSCDPNEWLARELERHRAGDVIVPFMRLNPTHAGAIRQMERWRGEGFRGVKIHPEIQRFGLDEVALEEFFRVAAELGLPVVTHTGVLRGRFLLSRYEPRLAERFVAELPGLTLIMAHAGGAAYFRQVLALMQSYQNVYADLAGVLRPGKPWYIPSAELALVRDTGLRGRLIYGADWPWVDAQGVMADLEALRALGMGEAEQSAILSGTLAHLLRLAG